MHDPQQPQTLATPSAFDALDAFASAPAALPADPAPGEISGRFSPANVAPVRAPARELTAEARAALVAGALPIIEAEGLNAAARRLGLSASCLRAWCLASDGLAYEAALRAHIGAQLDIAAGELEESQRMARLGSSLTVKLRKTVTSDGEKATGYTLTGPVMLNAARARASVALDCAKFWQWIGERRLPKTFAASDSKPTPGPLRASFSFIVDGRRREMGARVVGEGRALPSTGAVVELEAEAAT